jgi:transposase, IS30 family
MAQHLTMEERERISQLRAAGRSNDDIARTLGRHRSTLYRELNRNGDDDGYSAVRAQRQAEDRRRRRPRMKKMDREQTQQAVRSGLAKRWSPDQIAGRMRREHPGKRSVWVSRMTIYRWIDQSQDRAYWRSQLRFGQRRKPEDRRGKLRAAPQISGRPPIVDERSRLGDWEGDTIVGARHRSGLMTLVERRSGFALVKVVRRLASRNVTRAIRNATSQLPGELKHTLTLDNGKEFAGHAALTRQTGLDVYFARPYHAWERGSNEHFNGLLRAYFPKGTDFRRTAASEVQRVLDELNDRPRQRLGYRTPREVLAEHFDVASEL